MWNLGPIPVRGYALCLILGVIAGLWVTERRYRRMGGRPGLVLDIATVAVPAALVGARAYSVITDLPVYFGHGKDWVAILRIWDGGLGLPGAIAAGALGAALSARRAGADFRPMAAAAAPALAFGQAISVWGNWFNQALYGRPSALPWAVAISPEHRVTGFESFATFQPAFLYESGWNLLVGFAVSYAIRRLLLTGDRAFALYAGLYAIGRFCTEGLLIGSSPRLLGLRVNQVVMILVLAGAIAYLYLTRDRKGPDIVVPATALRSGSGSPAQASPAQASPAQASPADASPAGITPAEISQAGGTVGAGAAAGLAPGAGAACPG